MDIMHFTNYIYFFIRLNPGNVVGSDVHLYICTCFAVLEGPWGESPAKPIFPKNQEVLLRRRWRMLCWLLYPYCA